MIGFPKPRARVFHKIDTKRDADALKREVYAEVDQRDDKHCRCCGRRGNPNATTTLGRIHRAHILDSSRGGEMASWNICSLCWICHALEHTGTQLFFVGTDANKLTLGFEIHEAAVVDVFGNRELPKHVHIITARRNI
jgi:hypothetical protein